MFISTDKKYAIDINDKERAYLVTEFDKISAAKAIVFIDKLEKGSALEALIHKILKSVGINIDDVIFIDKSIHLNIRINHINEMAKGENPNMLAFGLRPSVVGLSVQAVMYEVIKLNGSQYLFADSLEELEANSHKKKALWAALKQQFNLA